MATVNHVVRSGNHIMALFDGRQIGLIQNVSMQDDYSPEPASGIGDIHVAEYVPTMARHTLNVSGMVLRRGDMLAAGIKAENGDAVLEGLVFDIVVADKEGGVILRKYRGCSYASGSMDVSKHTIVMHSAQFNALDVSGTGE
jgi:hypothetical protein